MGDEHRDEHGGATAAGSNAPAQPGPPALSEDSVPPARRPTVAELVARHRAHGGPIRAQYQPVNRESRRRTARSRRRGPAA